MRKQLIGPMPSWIKTLILIAGLALLLPGIPIGIGTVCATFISLNSWSSDTAQVGSVLWTLTMLTFVAGALVAWHASRSIANKPSRPLRLPPAWGMAGAFLLPILFGLMALTGRMGQGLLFPIGLLIAAAIPPLLALTWFRGQQTDGLSWRRGLVAFAGGATVSVAIAMLLELVLPTIFAVALLRRSDSFFGWIESLLALLTNNQVAAALTSPGFVLLFIELVLIAPLVEEFCKPLVTLPLIARLAPRDAFLVAAMAGAGFAALENIFYANAGLSIWAGILLVRATGAAIHPLGAGLVGLSWRDLLNGERDAARNGLARFGLAMGMHALWNGGSLLVVTLAGAQFFGDTSARVNVMGLSIAGIMLALLIVLGIGALWFGRTALAKLESPTPVPDLRPNLQFLISNRAVALWAVACLIVVVPASVAALGWLLR